MIDNVVGLVFIFIGIYIFYIGEKHYQYKDDGHIIFGFLILTSIGVTLLLIT